MTLTRGESTCHNTLRSRRRHSWAHSNPRAPIAHRLLLLLVGGMLLWMMLGRNGVRSLGLRRWWWRLDLLLLRLMVMLLLLWLLRLLLHGSEVGKGGCGYGLTWATVTSEEVGAIEVVRAMRVVKGVPTFRVHHSRITIVLYSTKASR